MASAATPSEATARLRAIATHPEVRRVFYFLLVGGTCAAFNLAIVSTLTLVTRWDYLPAVLVATELSVLLGFILNDSITFRALAAHAGGWLQRCVRFHVGAAAGQVLTIVIGLLLIHLLGLKPVFAQAISLAVVTVFNFIVQRFLTYAQRSHPHLVASEATDKGPVFSELAANTVPQSYLGVPPGQRVAKPVSIYIWARMRPPVND
jgi:putative flippase GtrA